MTEKSGMVVFEVKLDAGGLYTATSPQLAGVCVVHRDLDRIVRDMPNIMRAWFKRNKGIEIKVFQGPTERFDDTLRIEAIPVEIAAQAMVR